MPLRFHQLRKSSPRLHLIGLHLTEERCDCNEDPEWKVSRLHDTMRFAAADRTGGEGERIKRRMNWCCRKWRAT